MPDFVLLHGFLDTPRVWDLVLPGLRARGDVLVPALPGHPGGPGWAGPDHDPVDALERLLPDEPVVLAGNSLGGHLALKLAERGRARSVVAFAPAGGWTRTPHELFEAQRALARAPRLLDEASLRRAARLVAERTEHIPLEILIAQAARVPEAEAMLDAAARRDWSIDAEQIACPVRIVWGTADRLLPWPAAAERLRATLPHADWVVLDDVGHCPQLDVPVECAQLIAYAPGA